MPVTSTTPQKNYPSFSGIVNELRAPVSYNTASNITFTAADILSGFINRDCNGGARSDNLPAANALVAAIPGAQVGSAIRVYIKNTTSTAVALTLVAGTGCTLNAGDTMTVAQLNIKEFLFVVTALADQYGQGATYTVYSLGTSVF